MALDARGDGDFGERETDRICLFAEQGATDAVHADPVIPLGHRRDQPGNLEPAFPAKFVKGERTVLPAAEGENDRFRGLAHPLPRRPVR